MKSILGSTIGHPVPLPPLPQRYMYSGTLVSYVVPAGITALKVHLWGAGGGVGSISYHSIGDPVFPIDANYGGAGAMILGTIAVTPGETLQLLVGQGGGRTNQNGAKFGGGGSGSGANSAGGGRSAIRRGGVDIVTAGGGGGAGSQTPFFYQGWSFGGSATFSGTANNGYANWSGSGLGGSQTAGGAPGPSSIYGSGTAGGFNVGGNGTQAGAGGGGGHYGGGGSAWNWGDISVGAGGGSSFTSNLSLLPGETVLGYNSTNQVLPPNPSSPFYQTGIATYGGNGLIVIDPRP